MKKNYHMILFKAVKAATATTQSFIHRTRRQGMEQLYCTSVQKLFLEVDSGVNGDSYRCKNGKNRH